MPDDIMARRPKYPLHVSAPISFGSLATRVPPHAQGQRIGLLGGSFNPAHRGHLHISLMALKTLQLEQVWWLVSPGNPLKDPDEQAALNSRRESAQHWARHPRIKVTDFERALPHSFTVGTLSFLKRRFPATHFVWLMGADNLATFHHWHAWQRIARLMPIAVFDRPGHRLAAYRAPAAQQLSRHRLTQPHQRDLVSSRPPAWQCITLRLAPDSSTALRQAAKP